jgi:hypothetical protein
MTLLITGTGCTTSPFYSTSTAGPTLESGTLKSGNFTLVDRRGKALQKGEFGLLLYKRGTVCKRYFNENAANAICHSMG